MSQHPSQRGQSGGTGRESDVPDQFRRDPATGRFLTTEEARQVARLAQQYPQQVRQAYEQNVPLSAVGVPAPANIGQQGRQIGQQGQQVGPQSQQIGQQQPQIQQPQQFQQQPQLQQQPQFQRPQQIQQQPQFQRPQQIQQQPQSQWGPGTQQLPGGQPPQQFQQGPQLQPLQQSQGSRPEPGEFHRDPATGQFLTDEEARQVARLAQQYPQQVRQAYEQNVPLSAVGVPAPANIGQQGQQIGPQSRQTRQQ